MSEMRLFTPEEANQELAALRPLAERLVAGRRELAGLREELQSAHALVAGNGGSLDSGRIGELEERLERSARELGGVLDEIHRLGVQVKDLDRGLVDFPARHPDGETVLLCWELGEPAVAYWHDFDSGFAGRKPLPF